MSKTTEKTTKTTKTTGKTTRKVQPNTTKTAKTNNSFSFINTAQAPIELVKNVATKSIYFSLGLGSYLLSGRENLQTIQNFKFESLRGDLRKNVDKFITTTINKGEKLEADTTKSLKSFEEAQRNRVKEFFTTPKPTIETNENIEEKIEEVISSLDLPTRNEIHQLNRRLNELSKELSRQRTSSTSRKATKTSKTEGAEEKIEVAEIVAVESTNVEKTASV
ncbi:MAG: phasin family protein [Blastocatellia bacterium]